MLVWQEKREGGGSDEIGMRLITTTMPTTYRDDLVRQFFEDKLIRHLKRIFFYPILLTLNQTPAKVG
jgi:hypothetical protein